MNTGQIKRLIYQKASILTGLGNTKPSHIKLVQLFALLAPLHLGVRALHINSCRPKGPKSSANSINQGELCADLDYKRFSAIGKSFIKGLLVFFLILINKLRFKSKKVGFIITISLFILFFPLLQNRIIQLTGITHFSDNSKCDITTGHFFCYPAGIQAGNFLWAENQNPIKKEYLHQNLGEKNSSLPLEKAKKGLNFDFKKPEVKDMPNATWLLVKTILILSLFVAGFIFIFRFVVKKSQNMIIGQDLIQVISNVPISQGKFLQIVDIAGSIYVLGVSDQNISMITEISDQAILNRLKVEGSKILHNKEKMNFLDLVNRFIGSGKISFPSSFFSKKDEDSKAELMETALKMDAASEYHEKEDFTTGMTRNFIMNHRSRLQALKDQAKKRRGM